jgi:hypothetical protein
MRDFDPAIHTLEAYQQQAEAFIAQHGCTPMDVLRSRDEFPQGTVLRASFLDDWDIWLFSREESDG